MLSQTAVIALLERSKNGDRGVHARDDVGHCNACFLRTTAWQVITFTCDTHQAAHALNHKVVARTLRIGAGLTKACDGAINQARIFVFHALVVETILLETAHLEIFNQDVTVFGEFFDKLDPLGTGEVNFDRTFVAIGAEIVGRFGGVIALLIFEKRRPPRARIVT